MRHRRISEVMTRDVVSVRGDAPFEELTQALREHRVAAAPVVDGDNRVLGVVSEADLLRPDRAAAAGMRAEELMSAPAVCTRPESTVVEVARLMAAEGVKRLPVVDGEGRLVGVVGRHDLLAVFRRGDDDIRHEIVEDVLRATLGMAPDGLSVTVHDGRVRVGGRAPYRTMPAIERMCATVDGVVSVTCQWLTDSPD
ncbi:CBS domain-containing protein [Streptomyces sp. Da 82-17]|uniref:CBS domain-containing protein n=1 Tax=Streptomyces sp. Da 82-17 TaxID=3377116 RepID=UPI0038D4DE81